MRMLGKLKTSLMTVCLTAALLGGAACAGGLQTKADYADLIVRTFRDPAIQDKACAMYDLEGERREVMKQYYRQMSENKDFVDYFAESLMQLGLAEMREGTDLYEISANFTVGLMANLTQKGLRRAGDADLMTFFKQTVDNMKTFRGRKMYHACRVYGMGQPVAEVPKYQNMMLDYTIRHSTANELRRNYEYNTKLMMYEIHEYPEVKELTPREAAIAEKTMENKLLARLKSLPTNEAERLARAFVHTDEVSEKDTCDVLIFSLESIMDIKGIPGEWVRRKLVNGL